jgi:multicomponent K+:H+ antiporter subunit D
VVLNLIGSAFFLLALGTLYGLTGTLNMADMALRIAADGGEQTAMLRAGGLLLVVVFGLKAAILPLHPWLPALYGSSLAPVAALFAVMTKVGVYAIVRATTLIFPSGGAVGASIAAVLPVMALCTLAAGGLGVLAADRLRTLIAYLVILSVGTLLAGVGRMTDQGLTAALYYLPHTTLVTGGLFLLTEPIARLRGQWGDTLTKAPATVLPTRIGMLFFLGAVAAAGLPPLSGFIGKLVLLRSVAPNEGAWLWGVVLGTSLLAMVGLSRAGSCLFWGTVPSGAVVGTIDMRQLLPASLLLAASVVLALAAAPICDYAEATARQLLDAHHYIEAVLGADKLGGAP